MSTASGIDMVRKFILDRDVDAKIQILAPESTRTSALPSEALGCSVAEIAKTIAFFWEDRGKYLPILVTLSGEKRVSVPALARHLGTSENTLRKMNANEVKRVTGFSIGGVPPFPHNPSVRMIADSSLLTFVKVWAAAGSTNAVMELTPSILTKQLGFEIAEVSE
jgi:prolyl-tRNA editing enzyme YbaK/EbsC (Cys-tRNA(Pro) deacylase)